MKNISQKHQLALVLGIPHGDLAQQARATLAPITFSQLNGFITFYVPSRPDGMPLDDIIEHVCAGPSDKVNAGFTQALVKRIVETVSVHNHNGPGGKLQLLRNAYVVGVSVSHQRPTGYFPYSSSGTPISWTTNRLKYLWQSC